MPEPVIGVDTSKLPGASAGARHALDLAAELGYGGLLFRSVTELSPTLDPRELLDVRQHAQGLGLHLEAGIAKVNPYMTAELPSVRDLGNGDYVRALARMLEACAGAGIQNAWTATANWKRQYPGIFQYDRFRTDAPWPDQLRAIERLLLALRPVLADTGIHLNVETHEEITSFEVVRLVEAVGPDVLGVTFDVANVVVRGEDPVAAARRCAPYTRMSHLRDVRLTASPTGFTRYVAPCGAGVIDWPGVLAELKAAPLRMWTIEGLEPGGGRSGKPVDVRDPRWQAGHPDLVPSELASLLDLVEGDPAARSDLEKPGDQLDFLVQCHRFLARHQVKGVGV
jgi:sugar phosphate isomerase/epimerase